MRYHWITEHDSDEGLYLRVSDAWWYMGWITKEAAVWRPIAMWVMDHDYPENTTFDTAKQARRALKAAAIVAAIGGFRSNTYRSDEVMAEMVRADKLAAAARKPRVRMHPQNNQTPQ